MSILRGESAGIESALVLRAVEETVRPQLLYALETGLRVSGAIDVYEVRPDSNLGAHDWFSSAERCSRYFAYIGSGPISYFDLRHDDRGKVEMVRSVVDSTVARMTDALDEAGRIAEQEGANYRVDFWIVPAIAVSALRLVAHAEGADDGGDFKELFLPLSDIGQLRALERCSRKELVSTIEERVKMEGDRKAKLDIPFI